MFILKKKEILDISKIERLNFFQESSEGALDAAAASELSSGFGLNSRSFLLYLNQSISHVLAILLLSSDHLQATEKLGVSPSGQ